MAKQFSNSFSLKLEGHGCIYHHSAYDCWKRRGWLIKVELLLFSSLSVTCTGKWHKIIFFWYLMSGIISIKSFSTSLPKMVCFWRVFNKGRPNSTGTWREKRCYHWFWAKKQRGTFNFYKNTCVTIRVISEEKLKTS